MSETHIYEWDWAMLGSEWDPETQGYDEGDWADAFEQAWGEILPDVPVDVRWANSYNGGRGLVCPDNPEKSYCEHVSEWTIEAIENRALEIAFVEASYHPEGGKA